MILSLSLISLYNAQNSGVTLLQHDYYFYYNVTVYNGQFIHVKLQASAPITLMIMNQQQLNEFSQGQKTSSLYTIITQSMDQDFEFPGGEYFVVAYNNVSTDNVSIYFRATVLPILPLAYYFSLPAPIGLGFFGVTNESGRIIGTVVPYQEAIGYVTVYSILAYNATPPNGTSPWGAGLQMNAVLQVNTTYGTYVYWLQNVVDFVTNQNTFRIIDNVWNYTSEESLLSNSSVTGGGYVYFYNNKYGYYYGAVGTQRNYSLPFSVILYTKLDSISPNSVIVSFGYNLGSGIVWYDNVTIHQKGAISAFVLVNPFNITPSHDPYDLDLVFAGEDNGEYTYFKEMNASLGLQIVLLNGTIITPKSFYPFGMTGEAADNLEVIGINGSAFVITGNNTFWKQVSVTELPKLYFQQSTSISSRSANTLSSSSISSQSTNTSSSSSNDAIIGLVVFLIFIIIVSSVIYRAVRRYRRHRAFKRMKKFR
ncbi:Thermopsin [Saccharolobus shibatae B12]|uniref:Thermopsin n=2 Tax=Saccharolobus shibatae TaxID=2286 RepID=A0A8F5BM37_SACSH|nr:Thermopsin [Saccharolobus shibatae B12]